jgi:hypothetical protein
MDVNLIEFGPSISTDCRCGRCHVIAIRCPGPLIKTAIKATVKDRLRNELVATKIYY